jgi:hypothetical protein
MTSAWSQLASPRPKSMKATGAPSSQPLPTLGPVGTTTSLPGAKATVRPGPG